LLEGIWYNLQHSASAKVFVSQSTHAAPDVLAAKCELAGDVLRLFGTLRFSATGWSMLPTVWSADVLLVEHISSDRFRVGDIALVRRDGKLCAHRVIWLPQDSGDRLWITQGDAMTRPDRPVVEGDLLGRVSGIIRSGKSIAVSAHLSVMDRLFAEMVRRSLFAARVFIYMTGKFRTHRESSLSCQG
jgi:hypothetical protein